MIITNPVIMSEQYGLPRNLENVLYVGQSGDLRRRFLQHCAQEPTNPLIKECRNIFGNLQFYYSRVPTRIEAPKEDWLQQVESALVGALSPPANRNIPSGQRLTARLGPPQPVG